MHLTKLLYHLSSLSVWLLLIPFFQARKKAKLDSIIYVLLLFIFIDSLLYFISPLQIKAYHNNYSIINLTLLFENIVTTLVIGLAIKEKRWSTLLITQLFLEIGSFLYAYYDSNYSLSQPFSLFRIYNAVGIGMLSVFLLFYCTNDRFRLKKYKAEIILLAAFVIYYIPNLFYDLNIAKHFNKEINLHYTYIIAVILYITNIARNLLLGYYAIKHLDE